MNFKEELVKELGLGAIAEATMLDEYVKACEAIAVRYHESEIKKLHIQNVSFSLRDKFAMMAISGLTSATDQDGTWTGNDPETVAEEAYRIADAMIKARSNES